MNKTFLRPKETRRYKNVPVCLISHYDVLGLHGLWILMVGLFCTWTSTIARAITARWCWKSIQLCNIFWMLMVSVVRLDKIDIFSEMETSAILSMSGPINWSFSSAVLTSRFICGQMMLTFSKLGIAWYTHWCASLSSFYSLDVSSTFCSSIVVMSASLVVFLFSSAWIPCWVCQFCWYTCP